VSEFVNFNLALRERVLQVLAILVIGVTATATYVSKLPKEYTAYAEISVDSRISPMEQSPEASQSKALRHQKIVEQEVFSRGFLEQVISEYNERARSPTFFKGARLDAKRLREQLEILPIGGAGEAWQPQSVPVALVISLTLDDPDLAVQMVNRIATGFVAFDQRIRLEKAQVNQRFFHDGAEKVGKELAAVETEIGAFKIEHTMALPSAIPTLRSEIIALDSELATLEQKKTSVEIAGGTEPRFHVLQKIQEIEAQRSLLIARRAEFYDQLRNIPENEKKLNALNRDRERLASQFAVVSERVAQANLSVEVEQTEWLESMSIAEISETPQINSVAGRNKKLLFGLGLTFGLAALYVFLIEIWKPTVRTSAQIKNTLGITPLVSISHVSTTTEYFTARLALLALILLVALVGYGSFAFL